MPTWTERLDKGQLDLMWSFLQFKGKGVSVNEIKTLEKHLDELRTAMVQKTGGQEKYSSKTEGAVNIDDLGTIINCIVIEAMSIYLGGGFEMLKKHIEEENDD